MSLVQPVSLADELELEPAAGDADEVVCPGVDDENLAAIALARFRAATGWDGPPRPDHDRQARARSRRGWAGGSADAAAALRLAAAASGAGDPAALHALAAALGADVPSQLAPERCLMTGIGEGVRLLGDPGPFGAADPALAAHAVHAGRLRASSTGSAWAATRTSWTA